ncbi:MAG: hypothetical protein D6679_06220 [Candidatus Hydrogenedentota bacterium]|nr:MAG: hypothetical protein D6679_06220 [Candidatus Hydrogenedentota bacterium]
MAVQVDGTIDSMYGPFIAEDPAADQSNYTNLDLTHLWVTRDADNFYFGIEINADIFNTAWGYYNILIDTTGDSTQGAPDFKSGSLGTLAKKIGFPNNKPEYAVIIQSTNRSDPANKAEIWKWNGSDWQWAAALDNFAVSTNNSRSYIELAVPAADIGSPTRIWTEVFSSGNGTNDPALDTLNKLDGDTENNEWNAPDFNVGTTGALAVSTPFPPALLPPRSATALAFDSTGFIFFEYPAQNPALVDHYNIYLGADSNAVSAADPSTLAGTTPWNATVFETTTVPAGDYFAIVEAVGLTGETALSNLALLSVNASGDSIIAVQQNEVGRTIIELSLSQWKAVHAGDTFFLIRILDYNSLYEIAHFNDTALAEKLAMINKANAAVFFDPNLRLVSDFIYSDTLAPLRYVDVVLPDGSPAPDSYLSGIDVRFEIPYLTTSDGVTLEGPSLGKEKTLLIRKLDEGQLKWAEPNAQKTQWVEEPNDRVVVITSEFSIWNVLVGAGVINNLDNLVVYPNPFNEADYYAKGHPAPAHVTFAFIPNSTERIEIFNVAGERVRTLDPNDPNEFESNGTHLIAKWDARNDFGRKVASGIYIFWIRANGQVKIGKIAVIK